MRATLGEFEHLILLAILHLGEDAYGAAVIEHLESRTGRDISQAAAYIALKRLDEKDLVTSSLGTGTAERGGRPRRYFTVSNDGLAKLRSSGTAIMQMWSGLEELLERRS